VLDMSEEFYLQIKIAVYRPNGEYIKQCNNTTLSEKTILAIVEDIEKELAE